MNPDVTVVLPVHNVERTLAEALTRVLDLAYSMGRRLQVALVDDGSTDGTYEVACELARRYPQVRVLRQPFQRGLGPALEKVRRELGVGHVVAHDGVTAIDPEDLGEVLRSSLQAAPRASSLAADLSADGRRSRRHVPLPQGGLAKTPLGGSFRWLRLDEPAPRRRRTAAPIATAFDGLAAGMHGGAVASAASGALL